MTIEQTEAIDIAPRRLSRTARRASGVDGSERSVMSHLDRRRPLTRALLAVTTLLVLGVLAFIALGPLLWLFKAATSTSTEILGDPFALWPTGLHWDNFTEAFARVRFGTYLTNTLWICLGSWVASLVVSTTGAYVIAIIRPSWAPLLSGAVLATLFLPGVVSLVALYLTIVDVPLLGVNLINTFWAIWLPAAANAFNVLLLQRSFAELPQDVFDAARIDGAGDIRVFWQLVLPMSRPVLGVVSLLTLVAAYKEFLWPLLALPSPDMQPVSVALSRLQSATELSVFMAALFVTLLIPVVLFVLTQRQFLSAAGSSGALKG